MTNGGWGGLWGESSFFYGGIPLLGYGGFPLLTGFLEAEKFEAGKWKGALEKSHERDAK